MFPLIKGLSSLRANALCQFFRFFCQITDFLEFAVLDQICFYHPASAAADDLVKSQIIFQILCSDSTCRHKTKLIVWCCHCFDHSHSCCCILPYMLPKRQCRYHDQYRHQDRKSFIPVGNLPILPDRNTAEPACHAVNGRKQVDWLINRIQKPYCLRPDIRPCQNRPRIRGRIKNKAQHTYQPRIKIRSKKLVFHLLFPHRCHEIVHYPEKITPKINNNKLWHKRNHFIRRTRKIMSLDSRP